MSAPIAQRIRLLLDAQKWFQPSLTDQLTGVAPLIASGADLQFELFICDGNPTVLDYTNVATVTVELSQRINPLNNNIIFSEQIAIGAIVTGATLANFLNGTAQPILITVPNALTQLLVPANGAAYNLAVYASSGDTPPKNRPILLLNIQVVDADLPLGNPSLPLTFKVGSKISFICADGQTRDLSVQQAPNGRWTLNLGNPYNGPGQTTYSFFCSDNLFRDVTCVLSDGVWTLDINPAGHS
jgi:hypothetical protein